MTQKAATGFDVSIWRSWASRMTSCAALQPARAVDLEGRRMMAEKRAAAAEIIAKEANAIRLKALLDSAREEAAARNIRTAEERFAAARGEWESVRQGLRREPDPYAELDEVAPAMPPSAAIAAWRPALAEIARRKALWLGGLPTLLLVGGIGVAVYLHAPAGPGAAEGTPVARAPIQALDAPAAANPDGIAEAGSGDTVALQPGTAVSKAAAAAPDDKTVKRSHAATAVAKARKRPVVAPPPPPSRPEPETLAAGAPAPVEQPRPSPAVE